MEISASLKSRIHFISGNRGITIFITINFISNVFYWVKVVLILLHLPQRRYKIKIVTLTKGLGWLRGVWEASNHLRFSYLCLPL